MPRLHSKVSVTSHVSVERPDKPSTVDPYISAKKGRKKKGSIEPPLNDSIMPSLHETRSSRIPTTTLKKRRSTKGAFEEPYQNMHRSSLSHMSNHKFGGSVNSKSIEASRNKKINVESSDYQEYDIN